MISKALGNPGSRTPQKFSPKNNALMIDTETVAIKNPNQDGLPKKAKTEVRHARAN